ncbi:MAG: hypothetical protein JNG83_10825 [Opitutaceae bacterium]|nr:hypothetical protein [Opitutaceae bacterium]
MLADFIQLITRRTPDTYERAFVTEVHATRPVPPDPRVEKFILACWGLIAVKHVVVIWVVHRYAVPFHQLWVNAPTFLLGLIATLAYYRRE